MLASIVHIPAVSTASMAYAGTTPQVGLALTIAQHSISISHHLGHHNIFNQAHKEEEHTELHYAFQILSQHFLFVIYAECNHFTVQSNHYYSLLPDIFTDSHYSTVLFTSQIHRVIKLF
jgi:hypothetical protein